MGTSRAAHGRGASLWLVNLVATKELVERAKLKTEMMHALDVNLSLMEKVAVRPHVMDVSLSPCVTVGVDYELWK